MIRPGALRPSAWNLSALDAWLTRPRVLALALLGLALRVPDRLARPQFWAEDATQFFRDDYLFGWRVLLTPVSGYQHFLTRVVAAVGGLFPYAWAPAWYAWASAALMLLGVALVASPRLPIPGRSLMALALVWLPDSSESFANVCNLTMVLPVAVPALFLMRPAMGRDGTVLESIYFAALSVTGALGLLFFPILAAYHLWSPPAEPAMRRRQRWLLVLLGAAAAAQAAQIVLLPAPYAWLAWTWAGWDTFRVPLVRVLGMLFLSRGTLHTMLRDPELIPNVVRLGLLLAVAVGMLWAALAHGEGRSRRLLWLGIAAVTLAAAYWRQKGNVGEFAAATAGERYFYVAKVMTLWVAIDLLPWPRARVGVAALLAWALVNGTAHWLPARPMQQYEWQAWAGRIGREPVTIPVNPKGWSVELPARPGG